MKFKQSLAKFTFYGFFIALGTALAEVFSFNYPEAIIVPWGYLPYGLLYVLFVDSLISKQVKDWKTVYLYGVLVGFITEGFAAKVLFFGWEADSWLFHGFAVGETLFLTFLFHPLFSFMLPVFLAKNFFSVPFGLQTTSRPRLALWLLPLYPLVMAGVSDFSPMTALYLGLTLPAMAGWSLILKKWGQTASLSLSKLTRTIFMILATAFFVFAYYNMENFGRTEVILPSTATLIEALVFTLFVFLLIRFRTRGLARQDLPYTSNFNLPKTIGYMALLITFVIILGFIPIVQLFGWVFLTSFIAGLAVGPLYFTYVVLNTIYRLRRQARHPSFT